MRSAILIVSALFSLAAAAAIGKLHTLHNAHLQAMRQLTIYIDSDVLTKHANAGRAQCHWIGAAPICRPGNCAVGYQACQEDFCGDGVCCGTGRKIKCCLGGCL